jgi:integrase/recombinase XerD
LTKRVRLIAKAAKVKSTKCGPHTFRHTFAVEFIRAGGDVFRLQQILGHTTLEMTRHYVHFAKSDLREAHRKFSPVNRML